MTAKTIQRAVNMVTYAGTCAFIAMLILKLADVINWSWWVVCAPVLIPIILIINAVIYVKNKLNEN